MKKTRKLISYLLTLALMVTLLSGLGYVVSEPVGVKADANTYTVVEIVPTRDMATFGYFVKSWTDLNYASQLTKVSSSKFDAFNSYMNSAGCGTYNASSTTKFDSSDYFKTQVLGLATTDPLNVVVVTKTPNDSDLIATVNSADFIVINETIPEDLKLKNGEYNDSTGKNITFATAGYKFSEDQVLAIFKKIAGVEGQTPVPYIIDFKLMDRENLFDIRTKDTAFKNYSGKTGEMYGYLQADDLYNTGHGIGAGQGAAAKYGAETAKNYGSDSTSYKLYKLLSSIDPATLYGLYFKETDGSYGINDKLNMYVAGPEVKSSSSISGEEMIHSDGEASLYSCYTELKCWPELAFRPNYLNTSTRKAGALSWESKDDFMPTMGWFEAVVTTDNDHTVKNNTVNDFCHIVGGDTGRGVVYSSPSKGIFYVFNQLTEKPAGGASTNPLTVTATFSTWSGTTGGGQGTLKIKNNTNEPIIISGIDLQFSGMSTVDFYNKISCEYDSSTNTYHYLVPNEDQYKVIPAKTEKSYQGNWSSSSASWSLTSYNVIVPESGGSKTALSDMATTFRTLGSKKNDYHPYRILIISDNLPADTYANRTVIAELVQVANNAGKGLAGGVFVDCVSDEQFDNLSVDLDQTYDLLCRTTSLGSIGNSKWNSFGGSKLVLSENSASSITSIVNKFSEDIFGKEIGVDFITVPKEYYTEFRTFFSNQDGTTGYQGRGNTTVDNNLNYINDDFNSGKRKLDFSLKVSGVSSYTIDLYVDVNSDFRFGSDECVQLYPNDTEDEKDKTGENTNVTLLSDNGVFTSCTKLSHSKLFKDGGLDYVGGFSWKLVVSSGSKTVSKVGYSAIHNESTPKTKIKILQIYPTDYKDNYKSEGYPHPLLILPTSGEITVAKDGGTTAAGTTISSTDKRGDISDYRINITSTGTIKGIDALQNYFKDILTVDQAGSITKKVTTSISGGLTSDPNGLVGAVERNKLVSSSDADRSKIYKYASVIYYFLNQLQDYEIDVTRYSVYGFNEAISNRDLVYNSETQRIGRAEGDQITNLNGTPQYGYTAAQLGLTGDGWKTEKVLWTEGQLPRYLVVDGTELIYGIRATRDNTKSVTQWISNDGGITYFGETETFNGTSKTGKAVKTSGAANEFDLVMIGFGDTLDYMPDSSLKVLRNYLSGGGPAFIGNGAISRSSNNTFGNDITIRNRIGITYKTTDGYNYANENVKPLIVTNDTIFSHYPYTVNAVMKASADGKQPYKLDLTGGDDAPIVAFAKYGGTSGSGTYGIWGESEQDYYVYKKNNIVFCAFGDTYQKSQFDQVGGMPPMAETLMIVNALVASSRYGSSSTHSPSYIDCIDDDSSTIDSSDMEDDYALDVYYFRDSVYTDYDAYDIAKFKSASGESTVNAVNNSGLKLPISSASGMPTPAPEDNVRWIPYLATLPTEAGGYLEFKSASGTTLNLQIYSVNTNGWVANDGGKFKIDQNGVYYIGIPLNQTNTRYNGAGDPKPGFSLHKTDSNKNVDQFAIRMNLYSDDKTTLLERHTIFMTRRVLYHAE